MEAQQPRIRIRPVLESLSPLTGLIIQPKGCYLGIDQSLTSTGIAIIKPGGMRAFLLTPKKGHDKGTDRLQWFYDQFCAIIWREKPLLTAIEGYSHGSKFGVAQAGELGGILRLALRMTETDFIIAPPQTLKKFCTGSGGAEKAQVSKELFRRYGVDLDNNDQVDAAGLALMAMAKHSEGSVKLVTAQKEALTKAAIGWQKIALQPVAKLLDKVSVAS